MKSASGVGTLFKVYLPSLSEAVGEEDKESVEDILSGSERILVVDDESSIVRLHQSSLGKLGYQVTGITSSLEALALFEEDPEAASTS